MKDDWRYGDDRIHLRAEVLSLLLFHFGGELVNGGPKYSSQSIYECAHDWVSQGNKTSNGIIKYYEEHYAKSN